VRTRALERYARSVGHDLVRRGFYSPIPDVAEMPEEVWTRRSPLEAIHFDSVEQLAFVNERLAVHIPEFDPSFDTGTSFGRYDIRNLAYDEVDSELLYAFVRHLKPRRVVELGSGFSSAVTAHACQANRAEGAECTYEIFDPYPRPWIPELPGLSGIRELPAQEVPLDVFDALEAGDVLFVDTTHTVKIGSEVNRIVLDVLPRLAPGVVVQFHDIFTPWEYHRHWIEGDWKWNEQYLLQAFLCMNPGYEVLVSCQALVREHAGELGRLIPTLRDASAPSAFWMRRR
jgi:Methyltransferase domain